MKRYGWWLGFCAALILMVSASWPLAQQKETLFVDLPAGMGQLDMQFTVPQQARIGEEQYIGMLVKPIDLLHDDAWNYVAEARLEMAEGEPFPSGRVRAPVKNGEPISLQWTFRAQTDGLLEGTLWLFLERVSTASGAVEQVPVLAKPIRLEGVTWLGLKPGIVRWAGFALMIFCLVCVVKKKCDSVAKK